MPLRRGPCRWRDRPRSPRCRHGDERRRIKAAEPGEALQRELLDAGDVRRPSTRHAAAPGPLAVVRSAARPSTAGAVASGARIKPGEPGEALHRDARGARCRAMPLRQACMTPSLCGSGLRRNAIAGVAWCRVCRLPPQPWRRPWSLWHTAPRPRGRPRPWVLPGNVLIAGDAAAP